MHDQAKTMTLKGARVLIAALKHGDGIFVVRKSTSSHHKKHSGGSTSFGKCLTAKSPLFDHKEKQHGSNSEPAATN